MSAAKYRVTAPNPDYSGETGKCQFAKGVYEGPVEDGTLMYFEQASYAVEALNDAAVDDLSDVVLGEVDPADLKGARLDDALKAAGLPVTGKVDDKRAALADWQASLKADADEALKGAALDQALEDAGLSKSGTADEKRERLAEHLASNDDTNGA